MVSEQLRELAASAAGCGRLELPQGTGSAEHPVCGDEIEVDVSVEAGVVRDLAWRAAGCPATTAVASVLTRALVGLTADPAAADQRQQRLREVLSSFGGLARHERHAQRIALEAVEQALHESAGSGADSCKNS